MTLKQIFEFLVNEGINADPRGKKKVLEGLAELKKRHSKMSKEEKAEFDAEALWNPYADTRILYGDTGAAVKRIIIGVDMEVGEVLLADRLKERGKSIDLIMAHHPEGRALANFYNVMSMQADILAGVGVSVAVAEDLLSQRIQEVARRVMPVNHTRAVDAARLLGIPFMCMHTPADNHVASYLTALMEKEKPKRIKDVLEMLKGIPEYKAGMKLNAGPQILSHDKERQCGRIFVDMTGGTEGSKDIFNRLASAGIGTIIAMHLSEEHFKKAKAEHINIVIAGHITSDNLGINLLLDKLEKRGEFEFIECAGFVRVKRK